MSVHLAPRIARRAATVSTTSALVLLALASTTFVQCSSGRSDAEAAGVANGKSGYDFIVVGSGAGGGPLAARLARAGKRVLLLEAGSDVGDATHYRVPAMHALSTEDSAMAWWYFVKHHVDESVEASDSKITKDGVLYPRGSALGGSTAVNAMVTVLPSPSDWNRIAELTGDRTFRADAMDRYYDRVREWLSVEIPDPALALGDAKVTGFLRAAAQSFGGEAEEATGAAALSTLLSHDINDALRRGEATGVFRLPLATAGGVRNGPREHLLRTVAEGYPLTISTETFVTRVLWSEATDVPTAIGVEVVRQGHVYGASLAPEKANETRESLYVEEGGEIVLSAGTFNSPQLLALSGVGDNKTIERFGIPNVVDRPGVGENLQDRYEASIVSELDAPLDVVSRCKLAEDGAHDPCLDEWKEGRGVYTTPGFLATVLRRSSDASTLADLQVFAVPSDARGYYPGYARDAARSTTRLSWLLLKAHTKNHDGTVKLASASPFARPAIHFRLFDETAPLADPDLLALVSGVKFVREIERYARQHLSPTPVTEVWPGPSVASDEDLATFLRKETWGHHACCTDKMGKQDDPSAVVDARFRVIGARGLRVVDASVFPEIPGTFIALPTYMLAEKAADTLLDDAQRGSRPGR
jgi:choline dehydrogenase